MAFSSIAFLYGFLPAVMICYFVLPARFRTGRNIVLLLFSLTFYCWGGIRLLPALLVSCGGNWLAGLYLSPDKSHRKSVLIGALILNILMLG